LSGRPFGHDQQMRKPDELAWQAVAAASGMLAATAVRRMAVTAWRSTRHEDPPADPAAHDVSWPDALTWAIAVAIGAAVARVVAQRGAAAAWERATGERVPLPADAS
jgi:hypothetical protein